MTEKEFYEHNQASGTCGAVASSAVHTLGTQQSVRARRERIAVAAMQGCLASYNGGAPKVIASDALLCADALIAELDREAA